MWFLFGLVTLSLMVWASFHLRRSGAWTGKVRSYESPERVSRSCEEYERTHKNRKIGFRLGITAPTGFDFQLRAERGFDQFGKSLGVAAEQSAGDSKFDAEVFIDSDDLRVGKALRNAPQARAAVLYLFRLCKEQGGELIRIRAYRGRLWIEVNDETGLPPAAIGNLFAEALHALAEALTRESMGMLRLADPFRTKAFLIVGVSTGLALFGTIALVRLSSGSRMDLDGESMWFYALVTGVLMCLVGSVLAMKWLRASSRAHYVMAELLTVGMVGSVLSVHALAAELNRDFDLSAPTVYRELPARVSSQTVRCGKGGRSRCTRYDMVVEGGWPAAGRQFSISEDLYYRLREFDRVDVHLKPGLLGARWISDVRPVGPVRIETSTGN